MKPPLLTLTGMAQTSANIHTSAVIKLVVGVCFSEELHVCQKRLFTVLNVDLCLSITDVRFLCFSHIRVRLWTVFLLYKREADHYPREVILDSHIVKDLLTNQIPWPLRGDSCFLAQPLNL